MIYRTHQRRRGAGLRRIALLGVAALILAIIAARHTDKPPATPATGNAAAALHTLDQLRVLPARPHRPGYQRGCAPGQACSFGPAWTDDTAAPGGHNGCDTRDDVLRAQLADVPTAARLALRRGRRRAARPVHRPNHPVPQGERGRRADRSHRAARSGVGPRRQRLAPSRARRRSRTTSAWCCSPSTARPTKPRPTPVPPTGCHPPGGPATPSGSSPFSPRYRLPVTAADKTALTNALRSSR